MRKLILTIALLISVLIANDKGTNGFTITDISSAGGTVRNLAINFVYDTDNDLKSLYYQVANSNYPYDVNGTWIEFSVSDRTNLANGNTLQFTFTNTINGRNTLHIRAVFNDPSGEPENKPGPSLSKFLVDDIVINSITFDIDAAPGSIEFNSSISNGATSYDSSINFTILAQNDISTYQYRLNGASWSSEINRSTNPSQTISGLTGAQGAGQLYTLEIRGKNQVSNSYSPINSIQWHVLLPKLTTPEILRVDSKLITNESVQKMYWTEDKNETTYQLYYRYGTTGSFLLTTNSITISNAEHFAFIEAYSTSPGIDDGDKTFQFIIKDPAGNFNDSDPVTVNFEYDKTPPALDQIIYDPPKPPAGIYINSDVSVTFSVTDANMHSKPSSENHVFNVDDSHLFILSDEAGNTTTQNIVVDWIDKEAPEATYTFDATATTKPVLVSFLITDNKSDDINTSQTYTSNGEKTYSFSDGAGNLGSVTFTINNIVGPDITETVDVFEDFTVISISNPDIYRYQYRYQVQGSNDWSDYLNETNDGSDIEIKIANILAEYQYEIELRAWTELDYHTDKTVNATIENNPNLVKSYTFLDKTDPNIVTDYNGLSRDKVAIATSTSDLMGRHLQSIAHRASQSGNDIVQHVEYDGRGIQNREYLPYVSENNNGKTKVDAKRKQKEYYAGSTYDNNKKLQLTNAAYAETKTELSPLMRSFEQGSIGVDWQPDSSSTTGNTIKTLVRSNTLADAVRFFNSGTGLSNSDYEAGTLIVNSTIDEHGNESREYLNHSEQVILKESFNGSDLLRTYYVYDNRGNLTYIIPPELAKDIPASGDWNANDHLTTFVTKFSYDLENRLIVKQTPEAGEVFTVYDRLGRAVMTQDQNLKSRGQWLFSKYDRHGRVIYTGIAFIGLGTSYKRSDIQSLVDAESNYWEERDPNSQLGYTVDLSYPRGLTSQNILSINYYDRYDQNPITKDLTLDEMVLGQDRKKNRLFGQAVASKIRILNGSDLLAQTVINWPLENQDLVFSSGEEITLSDPILTRLDILPETNIEVSNGTTIHIETGQSSSGSGSSENVISAPIFLSSYTLYDRFDRSIKTVSENVVGGKDITETKYEDWSGGKVLETQSIHYRKDFDEENDDPETIRSIPVYDALNRIAFTRVERIFNQQVIQSYIPSFTKYNELGEAFETIINPVEQENITLNSDGIYEFDDSDETTYLYKVENKKNERGWLTEIFAHKGGVNIFREKLAYQNHTLSSGITDLNHNGNISAVEIWQNNGTNDVHYQYNYSYDDINQLKLASYLAHNNAGSNGDFTTSNLSYDLNGNIQSLNRRRGTGMMDQLDYDYSANKITKIEDLTTDTIDGSYGFRDSSDVIIEYSYDVNGNMSKDKNKGIDSIYYNHLNLPVRFVFNSGFEIHYEYDASGSKVSRKEIASDATQTKEYVYSGAFVYESHNATDSLTLSFMSTGNGRLKVENNTVHEEYFIKDHLGNTRSTLRSAPTAQSFTYQQQNHYYAFGLSIEDLSSPISPENSNRITYNGKEFDKELNWYHYGARFYDPQVGRWWSVDAADEFYSPYLGMSNNHIIFIDPDGEDAKVVNNWYGGNPGGLFARAQSFGNVNYPFLKASYRSSWFINSKLESHLNGYISKWKALAPKIAKYLDDKEISVAVVKDGAKVLEERVTSTNPAKYSKPVLGVATGLGENSIAMVESVVGNPTQLEKVFMHELIHSMGGNEFQAFSGTLAAGLDSYEKISKRDISYFTRGMPDDFKKYFNKKMTKIIDHDGLESAMKNYGKEIIGKEQ